MAYGNGKSAAASARLNAYPVARRRGPGPMSGYARPGTRSQLGAQVRISHLDPAIGEMRRLGLLPVAIANIAGSILGSLVHTDNKDGSIRLPQNATWYNQAIAGNQAALADLAAAGGAIPSAVPYGGTMTGGWATATAMQDAAAKYNQAQQVLASNKSAAPVVSANLMPTPMAPGSTPATMPTAVVVPSTPAAQAATNPIAAFIQGFTSQPGGQAVATQVVTQAAPGVVKSTAATKIGNAVVNNPQIVAGIIVGALALAASLGRRSR